jgi:chromosome partitioning protein
VLIPERPSSHDLRAVGIILELAEQARKPLCFVVNGATPRSLIALEAVLVILHQRIDFAASMTDGLTVGEVN